MASAEAPPSSATTAYRYAWFVDRYIILAIGDIPLRRVRVDHLDALYAELEASGGRNGTGLAPKTVLEVHMIIRAALDAAGQRQLVERNVATAAHVRLSRASGRSAQAWTAPELATFLTAARAQRLYSALHVAAHTGMRRGEIVGLKWSDLDVTNKRLSVQRTLQCVAGRPVEFGVKTRTSRRCIDLDTGTIGELRRWRQRNQEEGLPAGDADWMFRSTAGRSLNPESLSQLFGRVVGRTAVPRIRFHDVRHTHASLLIAAGVPVKVVSERLGHAHPGFTMNTYQHLMPGMSAAAADQFAALVTASR